MSLLESKRTVNRASDKGRESFTVKKPADSNASSNPGDIVAAAVAGNPRAMIDVWLALHDSGAAPLGEADDTREIVIERYLVPLARLLVGAFRASPAHKAVYLDERTRYFPAALDAVARRRRLAEIFEAERDQFVAAYRTAELPPALLLREYDALHEDLHSPAGAGLKRLRLLFVGDCLFVETRAFLKPLVKELGIDLETDHVFFNSVQGRFSVDDVSALIKRSPPDLIGLSLFSYQALPIYVGYLRDAGRLKDDALDASARSLAGILEQAVSSIRKSTDATIFLHNACGLPLDRVRRRLPFVAPHSGAQRRALEHLAKYVGEIASAYENVLLIDEIKLAEKSGGERACGERIFDLSDVPDAVFHTSRFGSVVAREYAEISEAYALLGKAKAVFVDFDNTLWDGVMAEGAPVRHHLDRQRLLKQLKNSGILLIAMSKNDPAHIRWSEMGLTPDDFVLQKVNWAPKPNNVSEAITELDLAPSAFVFVDDNPVERALVTQEVKGVAALDSSSEKSWRALGLWLNFPSTKQTEEARRRSELYREAAERRGSLNAAAGHDYAGMMRSLDLRIGFRRARRNDMDRLVELVQRTNQFNTTTKRRSIAEIEAILESKQHGVYVASLKDRFGKLGVVALAIAEKRAEDRSVEFDSYIMSCRAMGFGLESALLRLVMEAEPAERYIGAFVPTERNQPAATLYSNCGFRPGPQPGSWVLEKTDKVPEVPDWFVVEAG